MARRKDPQSSHYRGLALDFRPFDRATLDDIIERTGLTPVVEEGPARDAVLERMNTAAILLDHELQFARLPSEKAESRELVRMMSHIHRLRDLFAVSVARDRGLAPGDEPQVADGIFRLLGPQMHARLRNDAAIAGWTWQVLHAPDDDKAAPQASDDDPCAGAATSDMAGTDVADEEEEVALSPDDTGCGRSPTREIEPYDPADAASYFGADNANDILVIFSNLLALLEESAKAAQEERANAQHAERATPERRFVFELIPIYSELFGRVPGTSYAPIRDTPGGPLIRFLTACLAVVEPCGAEQLKENTLKQYVAAYRATPPGD